MEKQEESMGQFIGPRKVKSVKLADWKTPENKDIVEVEYEGGFVECLPKEMFDNTFTEVPSDWTALADRRKKLVTGKIIGILKETDIQLQEIGDIFKFVGFQADILYDKATNYLWTGDDAEFVPGMAVLGRRSFLDAQRIVDKIPVVIPEENGAEQAQSAVSTEGDATVAEPVAAADGSTASGDTTGETPPEGSGATTANS